MVPDNPQNEESQKGADAVSPIESAHGEFKQSFQFSAPILQVSASYSVDAAASATSASRSVDATGSTTVGSATSPSRSVDASGPAQRAGLLVLLAFVVYVLTSSNTVTTYVPEVFEGKHALLASFLVLVLSMFVTILTAKLLKKYKVREWTDVEFRKKLGYTCTTMDVLADDVGIVVKYTGDDGDSSINKFQWGPATSAIVTNDSLFIVSNIIPEHRIGISRKQLGERDESLIEFLSKRTNVRNRSNNARLTES